VCSVVCVYRDTALCLYFLLILLCSGHFWTATLCLHSNFLTPHHNQLLLGPHRGKINYKIKKSSMPSEIFYLTEVPFQSIQRTSGLDYPSTSFFYYVTRTVLWLISTHRNTHKKGGVVLLLSHREESLQLRLQFLARGVTFPGNVQ